MREDEKMMMDNQIFGCPILRQIQITLAGVRDTEDCSAAAGDSYGLLRPLRREYTGIWWTKS